MRLRVLAAAKIRLGNMIGSGFIAASLLCSCAAHAQTALEQYEADPAWAAGAKARLNQRPGNLPDAAARVRWHMERADAARRLGDIKLQIAELRLAHGIAGGANPRVVSLLASAEHLMGNREEATRLREESLQRQIPLTARFSHLAALAGYYSQVADFKRAEDALGTAEKLLTEIPNDPNNGWARSTFHRNQANLLLSRGRLTEAELAARAALNAQADYASVRGEKLSDQARYARGLIETTYAAALRRQGKLPQTEWLLRETLERTIQETSRDSAPTARVANSLALALQQQGRYREALELARSSLAILESKGLTQSGYAIGAARLRIGQNLVLLGDPAQGVQMLEARMHALAADAANREAQGGGGSVYWAHALVELGRSAEAIEMLRPHLILITSRHGPNSYLVREARGFLACALAAAGQRAEAAKTFAGSVPWLIERNRRLIAAERADVPREARLRWILDAYLTFVADRIDAGEGNRTALIAQAFRAADVARGSSVQRAVSLNAGRAALRDPALAELARSEQDLGNRQAALAQLLQDLLTRSREQQPQKIIAEMRAQIEAIGQERAGIQETIAARFPEYANLTAPAPVRIEDVRAVLTPGEVLLATYTLSDRTLVWAIPQAGEIRFAATPLGARELQRTVNRLRAALDTGADTAQSLPHFDAALASTLYQKLLQPVATAWQDARTLIVVPHGALGHLPFALLPTAAVDGARAAPSHEAYRAVPWLIRTLALVQVPTANAFVALRTARQDRPAGRAFAGFGDPQFAPAQAASGRSSNGGFMIRNVALALRGNPAAPATTAQLRRLPQLPDTAEEVNEIARLLKADSGDVFLGTRASETNARGVDLSDRRVLLFATHGLMPGDLDGLTQPALAFSSPEVTGERDTDGLLTMEEILGLKLNADWVVLSACNTAGSDGSNLEAVSGLGRAFFYAGARSLLVSGWPVETVSARLLTTELFRRQAEDPALSRAHALRQAMLHLLDHGGARDAGGKPLHSYAHPLFWAPFSLIGDGGASNTRTVSTPTPP